MASATSLVFKVTRGEPELVAPVKPTPHESMRLSDIDDRESLGTHVQVLQFYSNNPLMGGRDPVKLVREALAQTLVYYYPFAGRLREGPGGKLIVECTGEGVMFTEAEADTDVTLQQFRDALKPPFPCMDELLYVVHGFGGLLHRPLLFIQVTRLTCGGFVFALRLNHPLTDVTGLVQFMAVVAEMARGEPAPSVPTVTCTHHDYHQMPDTNGGVQISYHHMPHRNFFFGPTEVSTLLRSLPPHLRACSTFEVVTACLWRCRTISLQIDPAEVISLLCIVNAGAKFNPPLPAALTTAGELLENPLGYALELVRKAKNSVTHEYMKSVRDVMVMKGQPVGFGAMSQTYFVWDVTRSKFNEVDFGWGKTAYCGLAKVVGDHLPEVAGFHIRFSNNKGEKGLVVPICLPAPAMERFVKEMDSMLKGHLVGSTTSTFITSAL